MSADSPLRHTATATSDTLGIGIERFQRQRAYWQQQLEDWTPAIDLPALGGQPTEPADTHKWVPGADLAFTLPTALLAALDAQFANRETVLLAAFLVLLYRYSGQRDLTVGVPGPADQPDAYDLPLRVVIAADERFGALHRRIQALREAGLAHALPAAELAAILRAGGPDAAPLLPATWALRTRPRNRPPTDLNLGLLPADDGLRGRIDYNPARFDQATIQAFAGHYLNLLAALAAGADDPVAELPILTPAEQRRICVDWNATAAQEVPACVHHLIERQVARTPLAPALIARRADGGDEILTYADLDRRANQLAHHLQQLGVGPERRVGVCLPRSIDLIVALLGVLKAGGAYVPIDPTYPAERKQLMLADSDVAVVIAEEGQADLERALGAGSGRVTLVLDRAAGLLAEQPDHPPASRVVPANSAYMIYTSGSTGQPKGVLVEHRSLANFTEQAVPHYAMIAADRVLQCSSISWDTSAEEIYPCLASGGTLVLRTPSMLDTARGFIEQCREWRLSVINLASAFWHELMADGASVAINELDSLRLVIIGGERVNPERVAAWQRLVDPRIRLINTYGATEATAITTTFDLTADRQAGPVQEVPIGRPFPNVQTFILDGLMNPVPAGVLGDLYIGGMGLARGYHGDPRLTAEKFVPDPWNGVAGARLYRTGDVARYRADGAIEYFGRRDHQVKIRGHRIALGEIEATLSQHPGLRDVIVLAREDQPGRKRLVAYVVFQPDASPEIAALRGFLADKLPAHMQPAAFVALAAWPQTPNGKINRRALPAPEAVRPEQPAAPGTPTERALGAIWAELLEIGEIPADQSFFEIGGHSLLSMHLITMVRDRCGADLSLAAILAYPTLRAMARLIDGTLTAPAPAPIDFAAEARLDPAIGFADARADDSPRAVLLTGATGFLGAFLLDALLRQTDADVYCLVRAASHADAAARIQTALQAFRRTSKLESSRIKPVLGDLSRPLLGLSEGDFAAMAKSIDAIYHNGAWVNFVYPYAALKAANVDGTREIIRLAGLGKRKPLHFISTLAVAEAGGSAAGSVEEDTGLPNLDSDSGYVQSKWVAEKLVMQAQARGLPASIYRPDRIAGDSESGAGNRDDFFFRLLAGCVAMAAAPDIALRERMLPVDYVSQAIVHLSRQPGAAGRAFHLFNEQPVEFGAIIKDLRDSDGHRLDRLPYARWRELLRETATAPAHPLYAFIELFPADPADLDGLGYQTAMAVSNRNTVAGLRGSGLIVPPIDAAAVQAAISQIIGGDGPARRTSSGAYGRSRDNNAIHPKELSYD